jgi:tryptophanase
MGLISQAVGQNLASLNHLSEAMTLSMLDWGQNSIPSNPHLSGWISHVSNDHAHLEYSVALVQETGEVELRILIEAQPQENRVASAQNSALRLTADIA